MSLVNDMLRDLDNRKRGTGPESLRVMNALSEETASRRSMLPLVIGIAVVGVCLGLAGGYFYFSTNTPEADSVIVTDALPGPAQESASDNVPDQVQTTAARTNLHTVNTSIFSNSFRIDLRLSDAFSHRITNINSTGLDLVLDNAALADGFDPASFARIEGLTIYQNGSNVNLSLGLERRAEFDVHPEAGDRLLIDVSFLEPGAEPGVLSSTRDQTPRAEPGTTPAPVVQESGQAQASVQEMPSSTERPAPTSDTRSGSPAVARINREMSFADRDQSVSQNSINLAQRGQLMDAYRNLLEFIDANPEAHKSRETLIAILLTQQEFVQAQSLLNQGLALAPGHSPYQRLQARVLIQQGDIQGALTLLEADPPLLEFDIEYHDLMASLNQQVGNHARAITLYQNLLRNRPEEGRWWVAMGISHEALANTAEAIGSYQTALQMRTLDNSLRQYSQQRIETLGRQQ